MATPFIIFLKNHLFFSLSQNIQIIYMKDFGFIN